MRTWVAAALLVAAVPMPSAAFSEARGSIDVGLAWLDRDAWRFGRFSGIEREGAYAVLRLDGVWSDPWHSESARVCRVEIEDLGLDSRRLGIGFGEQGRWRARLEYGQQPARRDGTSATVMRGAGTGTLTLPADWVPGASTAAMSRLLPSLTPVDLKTERRRLAFGLEGILSERWSFASRASRERKEGLRPFAGVIGATGGNARAVLLPEPVDYETRLLELIARYTAPRHQLQGRYLVLLFENANPALAWQNPFSGVAGLSPAASFPDGRGRAALPPDNRFHQASVSGAWALGEGTRLGADVALGRMRQDASFLPYTISPALAESVVAPLPRASLEGRIDTTAVNLRLGSRAGQRLSWNLAYRYDDRDNRTARDAFVYIPGDSLPQNPAPNSGTRRFNLPISYRDQRARLDVGWRLNHVTRLESHAELRQERRTFAERHRAGEWTLGGALTHRFSPRLSGALRLSRSERDGSTYVGNAPFLATYAPGYTETVPGEFENVPDLRRFNLADRVRDRAAVSLAFTASERLSFHLGSSRTRDDYRRSEIGLTAARMRAHTLEAAYGLSNQLSGHVFYAWEGLDLMQNGQSIRGGANRLPDLADPGRLWTASQSERVDSAGAGLNWQDAERRWRVGLNHAWALSGVEVDVVTGPSLTAAPLPRLKTRLGSSGLRVQRQLSPALSLRGDLRAERYRAADWAVDGVVPNQLASVILFGSDQPDYRVWLFGVTLDYRF
jgi:MtrB/PioB family decaheme-associated outer membrane protein